MVVLLIIFLLLSPFFSFLCPVSISKIGVLGREACFLYFTGMFLLRLLRGITFSRTQLAVVFFILIEFMYSLFSPSKSTLIYAALIYISGPILFISLSSLNIRNVKGKIHMIIFIIIVFIIINLLLYKYQPLIIAVSRVPPVDVKAHLYRNGEIRFFGITFMPTIMAFICVCALIFIFHYKKIKIIPLVGWYLTGARLFIVGFCMAIFIELKKKYKFYLSIFFLAVIFFLAYFSLNSSDISLIRHFDDLFVRGPTLVIEHFYGCGLGNIAAFPGGEKIALESDIYLFFIQFGIWGGISYLVIFCFMFKDLYRKSIRHDSVIKKGRILLVVFFCASFFLPITLQRPIGNLFWIFEGLVYSYRRQLCRTVR